MVLCVPQSPHPNATFFCSQQFSCSNSNLNFQSFPKNSIHTSLLINPNSSLMVRLPEHDWCVIGVSSRATLPAQPPPEHPRPVLPRRGSGLSRGKMLVMKTKWLSDENHSFVYDDTSFWEKKWGGEHSHMSTMVRKLPFNITRKNASESYTVDQNTFNYIVCLFGLKFLVALV